MIELGLASLSPAILSRSGNTEGGGEGIIETMLWEMYNSALDIIDPEGLDDLIFT